MSKKITIEVPASIVVTLETLKEMRVRKYGEHTSLEYIATDVLAWGADETKRRKEKSDDAAVSKGIGDYITEAVTTNPALAADPVALMAEVQRRFRIGGTRVELPSK